MSSDNYGIIHRHPFPSGDKWGLTMCFASDDEDPDLSSPYFIGTKDEVHAFADIEHFEYGYSEVSDVDELSGS